ncbi:phage tail length tape measure family protein [Brucella anthropi]|uniref:phage tail length tape measure family protein n=1 Tax=Brucella anthropi TaxID=529 RepID=UPI00188CF7C4|nr:phage tail length tape measure family protein [Brucella anthropi]QPA25434.1 phage tail length tape measure family protein [Brucella anthropi]
MADIATLGLEVRSDQVEKGTRSLDKISGAAKRAEAAVNGFSSTSSGAASAASRLSAGMNGAEAGLERVAGAARQAQQSLRLASVAANDNIRATSKFNTANVAAQFQDIAVSAQMGMGAFQIGLQQGTQLAAVISMMENPLRGLGAAFMSVLSPVSLLTIGLVSLSAAGLQMVDWPKRASQALIFLADNLKAIAPYATTAAAALALIYAPSAIAGMVSLIAWMGRVSVAAIGMGASFALANPATALVLGFAAAVTAANIFRDELNGIFGRDAVADVKNAVNWIVGAFVGGFNAAKVIWNEFPDVMNEIGALAMHNLMEQIRWGLRQMVVEVNMGLKSIGDRFNITLPDLGNPNKLFPPQKGPKVSGRASDAVGKVTSAFSDAQNTDYVGNMYSAIESGASAAADKLRELARGLTDVDEKTKKGEKGRHGKTDAEYYQDIIDGADRRIASLLVERQALGMTEEAANALRYEQEMLNQAQQHGIDLTPKQADYIKMLAGTMAGLESAIQKTQDAINFTKDTTKGFFSDMANGLANGRGWWGSLADAAVNAITKIADALIDSGIESLFGGSGFGSLLGGLFGGKSADPWSGLRLASGGYVSGPGSATSDSIPAWLSNGEFVMNAQATKAFGPWLQAMNDNKLRGFAYGGPVDGNVVSMPSRSTLPSVREAAVSGGQQTVRIITETRFVNDGNFQNYIKGEVEEGSVKTFKAGIQKYDKGGAVRAARDLRQVNQRGYAK